MTFARFMELALYHPDYGYYTRPAAEQGASRIGWSGDFYTSSDVHRALGWTLAKQAAQLDAVLERPETFTLLEMGPGKGSLARDILDTCEREHPDLLSRLRYVMIDRSPDHRAIQRETLAAWLDRQDVVTWVDSLESLSPESVVGLFLSNELVDAFPVHRVTMQDGILRERCVSIADGHLVEADAPLSTQVLADYFQRLGVTLSEGAVAEVNLQALDWMAMVASRLHQGLVITIDYGHRAPDLYNAERRGGTLRGYLRHSVSDNLIASVGEQDLTSHVDFTSLARVGTEAGLTVAGFTNQMSLMISLDIERYCAALPEEAPDMLAIAHLLRPHGMGTTFKVLYQQKGLPAVDWEGLRYRPFLDASLEVPSTRSKSD
ncbi:SAM-dependent methyltransferase [Nitrospira sp.]|nr:SAM-dependent methyltransferase [Nitrospira sp.]